MKLHQLNAFITVLDTGSFSEASHKLGIAQASVSHAVAELEKALGVRLLERGRFGARATEIGEQIASHARGALKFVAAIEQEVAWSKGLVDGTLRLTAFRSAASKIVPKIIAELRKAYPNLYIQIQEIDTEKRPGQVRRKLVRDHVVDLAFVSYAPPNEKNLIIWKLMDDVVRAVVQKHDKRTKLSWQELANESLILPLGDDVYDTYTRWHLTNLIGEVEPAFEAKEDSTIVQMVSEGLGVGLLPELAIDKLPDNVKAVKTETPLERPIYVAILPSSLKVPAVRVFLQALKKRFPESEVPSLKV